MTCVRSAWLTLGALSVPLENVAAGYFCSNLDLGYPQPREVVNDRPDQDGVDDRTLFMGSRVVSADIEALAGAGAQIDAVASSFAPFMVPSVRSVLHYVLDRPGAAERTLVVRASGYSWPIAGPYERDIQLQFVAADPVARDPVQKSATAWAGSSTVAGRLYPLTFNRIYPVGGAAPSRGILNVTGDVPARPLIRVYGPITGGWVTIAPIGPGTIFTVYFVAGYVIGAGQWVDIDTANKTAYLNSDPTLSAATSINWTASTWPVLPAGQWGMNLSGSSTSGITQAVAMWNEGYLA